MAYDESKDKKLFGDQIEDLEWGIYQYGDNEPKVQIGPRWYEKNGERKAGRAGRLSINEMNKICLRFTEWHDGLEMEVI